jgi:hypothetical protein
MPSFIIALPADEAVEEKVAATCRHVMAARQLLDEEQATAVDLEWQAATTKKLVLGFTSSSTKELATNSSSYEDTVVANLHIQEAGVPNIRSLMNIVLDATSDNYARWHDNMLLTPMRHALINHVVSDDAFPDNLGWTRMDTIVLSCLTNTISPGLMEVVRERGRTAWHL